MKANRDYPLSPTPMAKNNDGELKKNIDAVRAKLKRSADLTYSTNNPYLRSKREKELKVLENQLDNLIAKKKQ